MRKIPIVFALAGSMLGGGIVTMPVSSAGGLLGRLCHHGQSHCQQCEPVHVHCCPSSGRPDRGSSEAAEDDISVPILIQAQPQMGMYYPQMPAMPMMAGFSPVSAASYLGGGARSEAAEGDVRDCCRRLDRLEEDFKELTSQIDELVDLVDRNTQAMERVVDVLDRTGALEQYRKTAPSGELPKPATESAKEPKEHAASHELRPISRASYQTQQSLDRNGSSIDRLWQR